MTNHLNRSNTLALRAHEARGLRTAVAFMTAGEAVGVPDRDVDAAKSAFEKLCAAPVQSVWIPFSRQELDVLMTAISNGAEGVLQPSSGCSFDQKRAFREAANRLADAGGINGPRY